MKYILTKYQILDLLKGIIPRASIVIGSAAVLFFAGYFILYKKAMHGTKKVSFVQVLLYAVMLFYITGIYGVTLMGRVEGLDGGVSIEPFWSYRYAWESYAVHPWRNLILNIIMFVPLGFLLPVCFPRCRRFSVTFACGLVATGMIECTQYFTKRGVFETDDLFNNALGAVIGYGFFVIAMDIYQYIRKEKQQKALWQVGLAQVPFVLTVIFFLFAEAHSKAHNFGELEIAYQYRMNMEHIKISHDVSLTWERLNACVYREKEGLDMPVRVDRNMLSFLEPVQECPIISSGDAYWKLLHGYVFDYGIAGMHSIRVIDFEITYLKDSKEYYQPVFSLECIIDEERKMIIEIPAIA